MIAAAVALMAFWFINLPEAPPPGEAATQAEAAPPLAPEAADSPPPTRVTEAAPLPTQASRPALKAKTVELGNDAVQLRVSSIGARVESIRLVHFNDRIGPDAGPVELVTEPRSGTLVVYLGDAALAELQNLPHEIVESSPRSVHFRLERDGVLVDRSIQVDDAGYEGELRVKVANRGSSPIRPGFILAMTGREREARAPDHFQNYQLVASQDGTLERWMLAGIESPGFLSRFTGGGGAVEPQNFGRPVGWAGIESQYFLQAAIAGNEGEASAVLRPVGPSTGRVELGYPTFEVPPGTQIERVYRLYFGPKLRSEIPELLAPAAQVGWDWVAPIVTGFSWALVWSYDNVVANYGVAIILLTILLRVATFPLTQKSMKSMKRLGDIAPEMKELQQKHSDDKAKLQEEMMSLYSKKGVNPVSAMGGGCLPMMIQMPFMIALYFALQGSIELRHAPFAFWIQDLSSPAELFAVAGMPIRPLPILMGVSMLLQQRLTPTTGDAQQKQMMQWMSIIFTFMFYQFPSGLLLYWFVSNLLGIVQQLVVNRGKAQEK